MRRIQINRHLNDVAKSAADDEYTPEQIRELEENLIRTIDETMSPEDPGWDWDRWLMVALAGSSILQILLVVPTTRAWLVSLCKFLYSTGKLSLVQIANFIKEIFKKPRDPVDPNNIPPWLSEACARALRELRENLVEVAASGAPNDYLEVLTLIEASATAVQALVACAQANPMLARLIVHSLIDLLTELLGPYLASIGLSPEQIKDFIRRLVESIINGGPRPTLPIDIMPFSFNPNCLGRPDRYAPPRPDLNRPWGEIVTEVGYSVTIAAAVAAIIAAGPAIAAGTATVWTAVTAAGIGESAVIGALVALGIIGTANADDAATFLQNEAANTRCADTPYIDEADEDYIDTVVDPSGLSDVRDFL